ncbi:hypothetical protein ACFYWX_07810 [Streptomyces sp. NPDC002888]|uniref:hypothetical protein n=1 Tax=Streptomyces sp. NPDC002888 TaxID=3364668 RepID=UPI0036857806
MLNSKKIAVAAAAGVLGSLALIGGGAGQGFAADGAGKCVEDGEGRVRCVQQTEYKVTTDTDGTVHILNNSTQDCTSSRGQATCVSSVAVPAKNS